MKKAPMKSRKERRKSRKESRSIHLYRVMKQIHPETGISSKAMSVRSSITYDIFQGGFLLGPLQQAQHLQFLGDLECHVPAAAKHTESAGIKAVTKSPRSK
ncbi:histone H2B 1.2-like [Stegostoma tigrinum]|uniref:histone H2B 1.2-like n=1 Tax=Stegostoma tigrinum TaxID=3053191 RepID=UPI002870673E|nr:histone H2B 1.2-like [Stegostoma tigrinum]